MKRKTREVLLKEVYLNRTEIKLLFSVSRQVANRIYNQADQIDSQMRFRAYPNKVRMQSVLAAQEISMDMLMEQIKNADAVTSAE